MPPAEQAGASHSLPCRRASVHVPVDAKPQSEPQSPQNPLQLGVQALQLLPRQPLHSRQLHRFPQKSLAAWGQPVAKQASSQVPPQAEPHISPALDPTAEQGRPRGPQRSGLQAVWTTSSETQARISPAHLGFFASQLGVVRFTQAATRVNVMASARQCASLGLQTRPS